MQIDEAKVMAELGITKDLLDEVLQDLVVQVGDSLPGLAEAIDGGDHEAVGRIGHFIKGSAANLQVEEIRECALAMEVAGKGQEDMAKIRELYGKMEVLLAELKQMSAG